MLNPNDLTPSFTHTPSPLYSTWGQRQTLVVTLATPIGGCTLGTWQSVIVTILKNADYNGVFSFTSDSLLVSYQDTQNTTYLLKHTTQLKCLSIFHFSRVLVPCARESNSY